MKREGVPPVQAPAAAKPKPSTPGPAALLHAATVPIPSSVGSADVPAPGDDHPMLADSGAFTDRPLSQNKMITLLWQDSRPP